MHFIHPATEHYFGLPGYVFGWGIFILAITAFSYIIYKRYMLIRSGQPDPRISDIGKRVKELLIYGVLQKKQPRYLAAGIIHIVIFWGFVVLGLRSIDLVSQGMNLHFLGPLMQTGFGGVYNSLKDIFELAVLFACVWACYRRWIVKPKRYDGSHQWEAYLVLGIISFLMVTDILYEGSALILFEADHAPAGWLPAAKLGAAVIAEADTERLRSIYLGSYWLHIMALFFFLNFLPIGKHFHIITALPNVFLRNRAKGALKPAKWGVENFEDLESCGVGKFEEFTWKHILDFLSCTECGRCSDNCPAHAAGRPLSPKMLTLKLRDYGYRKVPLFASGNPQSAGNGADVSMVGDIIDAEELWSCTTCGACEEECPVFIEYIDKIVDMRRHLIETSQNPKEFNKVFMNFETTGNPFGKPAEKRLEWLAAAEDTPVKILNEGDETDVLYYVDSYGAYEPKAQAVAAAIAKGLHRAGIDFGILGEVENDTGHQVRRMGEEGLFQFLIEQNMETLSNIRFNRIVTTDPHAFNTLKKDYPGELDVQHYSEYFSKIVSSGKLKPSKTVSPGDVYTYHDPCYLGRHNGIYEAPRQLLRSIPGLKLVEMEKYGDRSFCCGGGDIILWHEIEQETVRPAELRVQMARAAGANVMVTTCPFCFIHFEDAIKTVGLEDELKVVDLMALFMSTL
jgi:Fe-S oxidoreductase